VTRVVTETVVEEGETVEVTRVVTETEVQEVEVEVTKVVEVATGSSARGQGGTLNVIYWQAASNLNPYLSGGTKEIDAAAVVIEPLAIYDETGAMELRLAAEIPTVENGGVAEDLMSITWTLRDDILWSDGTPFTAADVVFTGEYCMDPDAGCAQIQFLEGVESIEAVDDQTVLITFNEPKPFPYGPFVGNQQPIIQAAQFADCLGAAAAECTDQNFGPIGTGAFVVDEFRANDVVVYKVNENYRDPNKPFFSEIIWKGGGDAAAAARAVLETGEADYAWNLQVEPEILAQMELAGLGKVDAAFSTSVERIMVNQTNADPELGDLRSEWTADDPNPHPFLSDPAVRKALSLAIDRATLTRIGYGPNGQPTCNVVPGPAYYVSTANDACLAQDIEGANALLDEAGWVRGADGIREKDGVRLSMLYQTSTNSVRQGTQALVKQWWEEIGVETELRNIDASVFFGGDPASPDTYGKFYADVEMYTNSASGVDLESYMNSFTCDNVSNSENQWLGPNVPRYCNPEYDEMIAQLGQTAVFEERNELVKSLNDLLVQDGAIIPLVNRGSVSAWANTLLGVRLNGWDAESWNIADWSRAGQ
jgi:peptide/nickel transport system substrate-binding protein